MIGYSWNITNYKYFVTKQNVRNLNIQCIHSYFISKYLHHIKTTKKFRGKTLYFPE